MKQIKIAFLFILTVIFINACQKEYSMEGNGKNVPIGAWQFSYGTTLYAGNIDSAYIQSSASLNTSILHLLGTSLDGSQNFNLELYADTIKTGTYKASSFQSTFLYTAGGGNIYQAGQLIGEFIVNVTSLTNNTISGTFSGSVLDSAGVVIQLTQGRFTSSLSQGGGSGGSTVSSGVLGSSSGNCTSFVLGGNYAQGVPLISSDTVQLQVTVATAGTYKITTNAVNGVTFSKSGTFTKTGVQTVTLVGNGTPVSAGNQNFSVIYGNSQCNFGVNFTAPATGTLGGNAGSCTPFAISGSYQQGIVLNATNTVQIQVNVATAGTYNITTNTSDGVVFSNTGTFSHTGVQTVTLAGSGTPTGSGSVNFTVTFGNSSCTFSITFLPGAMPSGDYFPITLNSNWTYSLEGGTSSDSVYNAVIGYTLTTGGHVYNTIASYDVPPSDAFDSAYYRKPGGDYYQYAVYSNTLPFDQTVAGEFIFLKDNVPSGTTWTSPNITGTVSGVAVTANIKMTLLAKAVAVT
ncbi:MAG: hypothetical protein M3R72_07155, partial [Bacteroidota bacterium]|nr:hypothetical protein [Bacteroidota bacterium]